MDLKTFSIAMLASAAVLSAAMAGAWWIQRRTRNTGWIDVIWSFSVGSVALLTSLAPLSGDSAYAPRQIGVACLVGAWSFRLGWHILLRTREVGDDPRYRNWIEGWGLAADRRMLFNLQIQAAVGLLLCLAVLLAAHNPHPGLRIQDYLGGLVLLAGIAGEMIADFQLRRCRQLMGKRAVCEIGLWRLSRHPNYFFEWLCWCAYPIIAIDFGGGNPFGWFALFAPVCMYWLLTSVSGIPPLEEHMLRTRGDFYRAYQRRTAAFFPLPKRSGLSDEPGNDEISHRGRDGAED